jgi:hypothetical protein
MMNERNYVGARARYDGASGRRGDGAACGGSGSGNATAIATRTGSAIAMVVTIGLGASGAIVTSVWRWQARRIGCRE